MPAKKKAEPKKRAASQQKYIRNTLGSPISIRLDNGRKIELKPRGQRGDTAPVSAVEIKDDKYVQNNGLIFETITSVEAGKVTDKQLTNQQAEHPTMKAIRNAKGEAYENSNITVDKPFDEQSTTVAQLEDGQVIIDRGQGIRRANVPGSQDHDLAISASDAQEALDRKAREKGQEAAHDLLADVNVVVDAPRKA